ncbi:unnamed protein product [Ophioblennius macclurei]
MEKTSDAQPGHPPPRRAKETDAFVSQRNQRHRAPKSNRHPEAQARKGRGQKEKTEKKEEVKMELEKEQKLKPTVVDIDSVRDDQVKEENLGLLESAEQEDGLKRKNLGFFEWLLMVAALVLVLLFLPVSIWFCIKIVREHERAVIFRLGHLLCRRPRGPGLIFYLPLIDVCHKVDVRLKMLQVSPHGVVTKDLVRPELSAVCFYQIENVALCSAALSSLTTVLHSLVQAATRDVLAQHTFVYALQHRRRIGEQIRTAVDAVACRWGIKVERADIDELSFPGELQQTLCAEAESRRQQQATVKAAESEIAAWDGFRASLRFLHPALVLPLPPDLLNLNPDVSSLPPPPPPVEDAEGGVAIGESETDSPMM